MSDQFQDIVRKYLDSGLALCRIPHGKKLPTDSNWQLTPRRHPAAFIGCNVGLLCGPLSGGLVAVDLDFHTQDQEAWDAAAELLPETGMIDGRPGKLLAHRFYRLTDVDWADAVLPGASSETRKAMEAGTLKRFCGTRHFSNKGENRGLDFIGAGAQVVIPPSRHEDSGTSRQWWGGEMGEPLSITYAELMAAVMKLSERLGLRGKSETEPKKNAGGTEETCPWKSTLPALEQRVSRLQSYLGKVPAHQHHAYEGFHSQQFRIACVCCEMGVPMPEAEPLYLAWNQTSRTPDADSKNRETLANAYKCTVFASEYDPGSDSKSMWPDPTPLPSGIPAVKPFDYELLPSSIRPWILDIATRMQCPPDYPAVSAMVCLSSLLGRKVGVRPKQHDDWTVIPNLWGGGVGPPGQLKTPALQEPLALIQKLEIDRRAEYEKAIKLYGKKVKARELAEKIHEQTARKVGEQAHKNGGDVAGSIAAALDALPEAEDEAPTRRRLMTNDVTVEKLGELLCQNPNGLLLFRDELVGFLRSLDREGHEQARAFHLEAWNGNGRFTFDRIGRGTVEVEHVCESLLGAIQPGPLADYFASASDGGGGDDGLMQRFQLLVWPNITATWENVDAWPNKEARESAQRVFEHFDRLTPDAVGADVDMFKAELRFLRFDADAQAVFDAWRSKLEHVVRSQKEAPVIEAHLSKFRSLIPSLAIIDHLAEGRTGRIAAKSVNRAIAWGDYLETHARRIYHFELTRDAQAAHALLKRITAGDLAEGFTLRDVYASGWQYLADKEAATGAVELLLDHGFLRTEEIKTGGRPKIVHRVHPSVAFVGSHSQVNGISEGEKKKNGSIHLPRHIQNSPEIEYSSGSEPTKGSEAVSSEALASGAWSDAPAGPTQRDQDLADAVDTAAGL